MNASSPPAVPIVALTAHSDPGTRERSLAAGCDGYILKPIDVRLLPEQVLDLVGFLPSPEGELRDLLRTRTDPWCSRASRRTSASNAARRAIAWGRALGAGLADLGAYQGHGSWATPHVGSRMSEDSHLTPERGRTP